MCQRDGIQHGHALCQHITGTAIDDAMGAVVIDAVSPLALEVSLSVQQELHARLEQADALRRKAVERAQYDVDLARQRFMRVDPNNRLVADSLEADWNEKLRRLNEAQDRYRYRQQHEADCAALTDEQRQRILALAQDVPRLWRDPATPARERKRMLRLIIEDVTLLKGKELVMHVRFCGGATRTLTVPRPAPAWALRRTNPEVVAEIDRLLDDYTDVDIARVLNERGLHSKAGKPVDIMMVARVRDHYQLKPRYERLRERGLLTLDEVAQALGIAHGDRETMATRRSSDRMATANPLWGAPRIHGELQKLGIAVSQSTVAKYMPRRETPPSQTWRTFLANHVESTYGSPGMRLDGPSGGDASTSRTGQTRVGAGEHGVWLDENERWPPPAPRAR